MDPDTWTPAGEDEALLGEVLGSKAVSDAIFGFHCQQAASLRTEIFEAWRHPPAA